MSLSYLVGWSAIITYRDMPCFLFENTLLLLSLSFYYLPCAMLISCTVYYTIIIFHCKFPVDFFSTCIITPAYFFDILRLLIPLYPPAIKNPQKKKIILWKNNEIIYLWRMQILMYFTCFYGCWDSGFFFRLCSLFYLLPNVAENKKLLLVTEDGIR